MDTQLYTETYRHNQTNTIFGRLRTGRATGVSSVIKEGMGAAKKFADKVIHRAGILFHLIVELKEGKKNKGNIYLG